MLQCILTYTPRYPGGKNIAQAKNTQSIVLKAHNRQSKLQQRESKLHSQYGDELAVQVLKMSMKSTVSARYESPLQGYNDT